ncbi:MAG TPA: hypothetical protein VK116_12100, partial [Planctomycetota bacterium]|nr:hypothetical protein [Planctomycetota bacterium]
MTGGQVALHILSGAAAMALAILLWASARGSSRRGAEAQGADRRDTAGGEAVAPVLSRIGAPLLLATAWGAGHAARLGEPGWNAGEDQAFWVALAALPLAVIAELGPRRDLLRSLLIPLLLAGAFAYLVVIPGVRSEWRDAVREQWIAGVAIGFAGFAYFLAALREGAVARGFSWPARLIVSAGAVGGIAVLSSYAKLTESSAVLAAVLIPPVLVLLLARDARLGAGASLVAASILASLLAGAFLQTFA